MTRTYLRVAFAEKDEAKALGARWDAGKKLWYVQDREIAPFERWLGDAGPAGPGASPARAATAPAVRTGPAQLRPHCGCAALPWEPCVHAP